MQRVDSTHLFVSLLAFVSMPIAHLMQPVKEGLTNPLRTLPQPTTRGSGLRWTLDMERWLKWPKSELRAAIMYHSGWPSTWCRTA